MSDTYRKESRKDWVGREALPDSHDLMIGCLQRIADATELMAKSYQGLINERYQARQSRDYWQAEHDHLLRRLNAAKGQITKLKRKATGETA